MLDTTNCSSKDRQPAATGKELINADAINAISPLQSIAAVMQERGERYRERVASVSERVIGHVETMHPDEILTPSAQVEKIDTVARRTFELDKPVRGSGTLNLNVLAHGGRTLVQINQEKE